jgi:nucleotide-binding universal stress UspA family protein
MFKTILVPIDLNHEDSWRVSVPLATEMVRASGGTLHFTTVVPDYGAALVQDYFPKDFERSSLAHAESEMERLFDDIMPDDVTYKLHLEHGSIRTHVLARAKDIDADLIVMASHPPDQLREFLVGSHADWIVRHAPISVLVVRGETA